MGLPKGAQRESKLSAAHACQMFGEGVFKTRGGAAEEVEEAVMERPREIGIKSFD